MSVVHTLREMAGRKGMFYTLVVVLFMAVLLVMFFAGSSANSVSDARLSRVTSMDDFLTDFHRDVDRAAFISGFRTFLGMEGLVVDSGDYLINSSEIFIEIFLNATYNNQTIEIVQNSSFSDYLARVESEAAIVGLFMNISVLDVQLYHIDPWDVVVDYTLRIHLRDRADMTRWDYERRLSTVIPIIDLRDPLYAVGTSGKVPNTIRFFENFTEFVDDAGDKNDTTELARFLNGSYYRESSSAPNFLMRLEGDFGPDIYGIESLVNLDLLDAQSLTIKTDRSVVDYLYFSTPNSADQCAVQNMPNYFKLDDEHMDAYEIDGELEYSACP